MLARIYQPTPSAMQSGTARSKNWILEFVAESSRPVDPLMGWTGSSDTREQVRLEFGSREEAVSYAKNRGIPFRENNPHVRKHVVRKRGYADNFAHDRKESWTH